MKRPAGQPLARLQSRRQHGVTLVELVVVLTIMGVVASVGATLVGRIVAGQQDNRARLVLATTADAAVAGMADDLARALPNSLRLTSNGAGVWIEIVPVLDAGRYRAAPDTVSGSPGDPLDLENAADNAFDVIGTALAASTAGKELVFNNQGTPEADVYSGNNRRGGIVLGSGGQHVTFTAAGALPAATTQPRFFVVGTPITLACVAVAGGFELRRYTGYGWLASQPVSAADLAGASNSLQLGGLTGCSASYSNALANIGLLILRLNAGVAGSGTAMELLHQLLLDNAP
jgi:MSHA biogenesis protein MshO